MAITNHDRVGKMLELLKAGLGPFAEQEFANTYHANEFRSKEYLDACTVPTYVGMHEYPQRAPQRAQTFH